MFLPTAQGGNAIIIGTTKGTNGTSGSVLFIDSSSNINQNNSNLFWDNTNGRLGIGTTAPTAKLDVRDGGATADSARVSVNNAMTFQGVAAAKAAYVSQNMYYDGTNDLRIDTNSAAARLMLRNDGAGGSNGGVFNFQTVAAGANPISWTSRMIIDSSGNVGIGVTNPSTQLQLGQVTTAQTVVSTQSLFGNNTYYDGNWKYITTATAQAMRMQGGDITFNLSPSGTAGANINTMDTTDVKMTIKNSGNVGIGTTSFTGATGGPQVSSPLDKLILYDSTSEFNRFKIQGGTAGGGAVIFADSNNVMKGYISSDFRSGNLNLVLDNKQNGPIYMSTNDTVRLTIDGSGNVGIGTTGPNAVALLDISSTTKGFLPPRMTTTQRDAISTPPAGLFVYNSSTNKLNFYNGTAWEAVTSA